MTIALLFSLEGFAMNNEWFQTWDRPEYQEWAKEIPEGYLLHIIRKEPGNYLAVQAKLIMGEKGLPGFEVIKQNNLASAQEAMKQIEFWEESQIAYP
jgi:hypothetical protein